MWEAIIRTKEYQKRLENCLQEELEIQAVVGANGFGAGKGGREKLWNASVELTAWKEVQGEGISRDEILLSTPADDQLLKALQSSVAHDSVIRCRVRRSKNGRFLLLAGPVQAGDDPELQKILEEQIKEITMEVEGLGTFTLERTVDWFEKEVDWLGTKVTLSFDQDEEEIMEDSMETARILMANPEGWDSRVRECAVNELLELANDWAADGMEEEELERLKREKKQPVSREQFMEHMELESIQVEPDGGFEFWFGDGDLFYGHSIHVAGDVKEGPDWAQIEG